MHPKLIYKHRIFLNTLYKTTKNVRYQLLQLGTWRASPKTTLGNDFCSPTKTLGTCVFTFPAYFSGRVRNLILKWSSKMAWLWRFVSHFLGRITVRTKAANRIRPTTLKAFLPISWFELKAHQVDRNRSPVHNTFKNWSACRLIPRGVHSEEYYSRWGVMIFQHHIN